jgi:hypothetical protein
MPKTTGVTDSKPTEENPNKDKVIRHNRHKVIHKVAGKVSFPKTKAVTPKWIRVTGADSNKEISRVDKKADRRKVMIVLPKARVNLQWTVRWQMIRYHIRWSPEENRIRVNLKVEENRKTRLPILQSRRFLLHLLPRARESGLNKAVILQADRPAKKAESSSSPTPHLRRMFKSPELKRIVERGNPKVPEILLKRSGESSIRNPLRVWSLWNRSLQISQTKLNKKIFKSPRLKRVVAKAIK